MNWMTCPLIFPNCWCQTNLNRSNETNAHLHLQHLLPFLLQLWSAPWKKMMLLIIHDPGCTRIFKTRRICILFGHKRWIKISWKRSWKYKELNFTNIMLSVKYFTLYSARFPLSVIVQRILYNILFTNHLFFLFLHFLLLYRQIS